MDVTKIDVYCPNLECGELESKISTFTSVSTKKHRKMTYMGQTEEGENEMKVVLHNFQCPVCSKRKNYVVEDSGALKEVPERLMNLFETVQGVNAVLGALDKKVPRVTDDELRTPGIFETIFGFNPKKVYKKLKGENNSHKKT